MADLAAMASCVCLVMMTSSCSSGCLVSASVARLFPATSPLSSAVPAQFSATFRTTAPRRRGPSEEEREADFSESSSDEEEEEEGAWSEHSDEADDGGDETCCVCGKGHSPAGNQPVAVPRNT